LGRPKLDCAVLKTDAAGEREDNCARIKSQTNPTPTVATTKVAFNLNRPHKRLSRTARHNSKNKKAESENAKTNQVHECENKIRTDTPNKAKKPKLDQESRTLKNKTT
jgi:hypothetical protein